LALARQFPKHFLQPAGLQIAALGGAGMGFLSYALLHDRALHENRPPRQLLSRLWPTGFFGPDSWYMNGAANIAYAAHAKNRGKLTLPVLFLHGAHDYTCETIDSRLAEPMRRDCADLTEVVVPSGHWMAQERPVEVNPALAKWLAIKVPDAWPT
jgi:pimeloyl-ACP methyl ester carboxylesterase